MYLPNDYVRDNGYSIRPDTPEQQVVYSYIRGLATRSPQEAIDAFYRLLWDGSAYPDNDVHAAWKDVVKAPNFEHHQLKVINRCYYTLTNPWHLDGTRDNALEALIVRLDGLSSKREYNPHTKKLRSALREYKESDYYAVLKKHLHLLRDSNAISTRRDACFGDLFADYFFIHEAGTQTRDIEKADETLNQGILQKRNSKLSHYGNELHQFYVRYGKMPPGSVHNPTHLPDKELHQVISFYRPKRSDSFREKAAAFKRQSQHSLTTEEFGRSVYHHIMQPVSQINADLTGLFGREFQKVLKQWPKDIPLTQVVRIEMFRKLLNVLIKHDESQSGGDKFCHLVMRVGSRLVSSLLLNIVMACEMVRFELEKRLAYLHHRFADVENDEIPWLVKAFDYLNIAFALNARHLGYFSLASSIPDSM
ncbi:MAG: hypothetical protein WBA57_16115 [Elainellaceae cyanobacterium]